MAPKGRSRKLSGMEKLDRGPNSYKKDHINKQNGEVFNLKEIEVEIMCPLVFMKYTDRKSVV